MPNVLDRVVFRRDNVDTTYYVSNSINGYYNKTNGKFYKESTYTTELETVERLVYLDLSTNSLYRYDALNTKFIQMSGSGGGLEYVDTLPVPPNIKDAIYGYYSTVNYTETVATDFLDDNEYFTKSGNDYTPKTGVDLTVSDDDVTYNTLVSLVLNGTDYDATYDDSTTHTFSAGDTFYYKIGNMKFYAGDATNQVFYILEGGGGGGGVDYAAGFGIDINGNIISTTDFVGTQAQWNALPAADQAKYDFVWITDDVSQIIYQPGHAISDGTTEKTQRNKLVFDGFTVTDDSTNEVTKIEEVPYTAGDGIDITNKEVKVTDDISRTWTGTRAQWDAISDKSPYDGWIINITDDFATGAGPVVDVVQNGNMNAVTSNAVYDAINKGTSAIIYKDGTKTYKQLGDALYDIIDSTKITSKSILHWGPSNIMKVNTLDTTKITFSMVYISSSNNAVTIWQYELASGSSHMYRTENGSFTDFSSNPGVYDIWIEY